MAYDKVKAFVDLDEYLELKKLKEEAKKAESADIGCDVKIIIHHTVSGTTNHIVGRITEVQDGGRRFLGKDNFGVQFSVTMYNN